jgi:thymidine kinase
MAGSLEVYCGPMFSGKSTIITSEILKARNAGKQVLALKPAYDTRHGEEVVSTHSKLKVRALSVTDFAIAPAPDYRVVFLDEVQFFAPPFFTSDIIQLVKDWRRRGIDVVAGGLDMDWRGNAFPITAELCAMADKVTKLTAICSICGWEASKTMKLTHTDIDNELGSDGLYEPRCNSHWHLPLGESDPS